MKYNTNYLILILFAFLFFNYSSISAYPKFAAYMGDKCMNCHVNPTGGGMRQGWGLKFSKNFLYMKMFKKANDSLKFNPQVSDGIQIGADMRLIFIDDQQGEGVPNRNTFFQMQGDLYVNAKINKYLNLVIAPGLYIPVLSLGSLATKYEIYGMVSNLPAGLRFRVGRFIPNFGIKVPEHRAYNRDYNGFYTPYASDAGIEAGISLDIGTRKGGVTSQGSATLTAEVSNGQDGERGGRNYNALYDADPQKQITVSGEFRWAQKDDKYTFAIGASFINDPFKFTPSTQDNINAVRKIGAGFFSIGLFERVAILGEIDYNRLDIRDSLATRNDFKTYFGEVDISLIQGIEAKFQVEAYDPNLGFKGPDERRRYSFGLMFYPLTGLEIESIFRIVKEPGLEAEIKNNEYQTVFKFYY